MPNLNSYRAAAARCRMKRKSWIVNLEKKADEMQSHNSKIVVSSSTSWICIYAVFSPEKFVSVVGSAEGIIQVAV